MNSALATAHGYTPEEIVGKPLSIFHTPEQVPSVEVANRQIQETGVFSGEIWHVRRDGAVFPTLMHNSLLRDEAGNPLGMIATLRDITARKQTEEALRESEERFRSIVENSQAGILIVGEDFCFIYVNDKLCRILDRRQEEIVGHDFREFLDEESRAFVVDHYRRRQAGEDVPPRYEFNAVRRGGELRRVEIASTVIRDGRGRARTIAQILDITERVRSEEERAQADEALRASEKRFRSIAETASDAIVIFDSQDCIFYWNQAAQIIFGYQAGETHGKLLASIVPERFHDIFRQEMARVASAEASDSRGKTVEMMGIRKDGSEFPLELSLAAWRTKENTFFTAIVRDITARVRSEQERAQAEKKLRESEQRYRALFEHSNDGVFVIDSNGVYIAVNQRGADMLGYEIDELVGKNAERIVAPEELADAMQKLEILLAGPVLPLYERTLLAKDGTRVPTEINLTVVRDAKDRPLHFQSIVRDITERVRSEEERAQAEEGLRKALAETLQATRALRESEERYRNVYDTAPLAFVVWDRDCLVTDWNKHAEELFGWSREDVLGRNFFEFLIPEGERPQVEAVVAALLRGETPSHDIHENLTKDGKVILCEWSNSIRYDSAGQVVGAMSLALDITGRKRAEREARRRTRDLALINTLNHAVNQGDSLQDVIDLLCRETRSLFSGSGVAVYLLDQSKEHLVLQNLPLSLETVNRIEKLIGIEIPPVEISLKTQTVYRKILQTSDIQISDDPATIKKMMVACTENKALQKLVPAIYKLLGYRPVMSVPLVSKGEVIGLMDISRKEPFTESDLERSAIISKQLTALIKRKQAEEALEFRVKQLAALGQASRAVTASLELDQVLAKIVSLAGEVVTTDYTSVVLIDETGQMNDSADNVPGIPTIEYRIRDEGLTDWIVRSRWVAVIDEIGEDGTLGPNPGEGAPRFANPLLVEAGVRSLAGLPLVVKDRLLGVLYLHSLQTNAFRDQLPLLIAFANQVAIAIENARLYEKAQRELAERERVEKALRASQEYARSVIDSSLDMIITVTMDRRIVEFNQAAQATFGYDQESVVGKPVDMLYADQQEAITIHETTIAKGQCVQEIFDRRKNGEIFPALLSASVLRDAQGKAIGVMGVSRDIAENKRIEKQLRQQERMAAVGQLSGGIAHDFNNFLTAIMLYAQLLLAKPHLPLDLAPNIEIILDESRGAARLVQQILDFSRRAMIETGPVDLRPSIGKTVSILGRTLPETIRLVVETEMEEHTAPFTVNADPTRIQQVLMNLALNARDAMPLGGELGIGLSRVEVKAGDEPPAANMPAGDWVCLTISDTGTGIPPDVLPHVFEPFFTTKGPGKGTGLGLAQVHGIVGQHRGHIRVETEIGQGTTFRVYLPAHEAKGTGESPEKTPTAPEGKGETILLAEDEERVRKAGREILESLGYRVLVAADGREALEVYRSAEEIHLVITDLMMPEMGGSELAQELKKEHPHVKVLAITGYALGKDKYLEEAGILAVVQKPFDVDTLAKTVRWALEAERP